MDEYEWKKTLWTASFLILFLVIAIIIIVRIETKS